MNRKVLFIFWICFSLTLIFNYLSIDLVICAEEKEDISSEVPDWLRRINLGIDFGTDQKPRIYFETVQPLYQDTDKENTFFIQPRYSLESEESAYNLGFGYRKLFSDNATLLGVNSFFDFEDDDQHYRAGLGFEAFVYLLECRLNNYIGMSPRRLVKEVGAQKEYEKAVDGLDWEFGMPLPFMNWIKFYGGGNWYNYEKFENKEGWRLRTEVKPFKYTTFNLIFWDDNKGDAEFRVDSRITIPFGPGGEDKSKICNIGISNVAYPDKIDHSERTLDRVEREYKIEVERWVETASAIIEVRRGN